MLACLAGNVGYIIVTLILVLLAAAVIRRMIKDRKNGGVCGCGCRGCANAPYCHPEKE